MPPAAIGLDELQALDGYWRAANYLTVGQIYLLRRKGHSAYVAEHFEDLPEIRDWTWTAP